MYLKPEENKINDTKMDTRFYTILIYVSIFEGNGDATLLVISSLNVLVNQTITISCLFETGQKGVIFQFPDKIYSAQYCSMISGKLSLDCPNNQTYRLNATVSLYWHKKQFYCDGLFGGQPSNPVTLDVTVPVSTLILSPTKLSVTSGKIIYLECQTSYCNPPSTIIWYINGEKVAGNVNVTIDTSSTGLSRTTSVLQYTALTSDDGNPILCTASNIERLTIQSRTHRLDVRYISDVKIIPAHNVYVTAGTKRVLIHCYVENANPETVEYQWSKGTSSNLSLISYSQTLVLKTVDKKDGGQYCCRATNAVGTSNSTIKIIIQYTPLAAKIIDVICLDSRAFLLWTSSYTNSSDDIFEEKLQYKRYEDKLFELSDNQNWNRTNNHCQLTQITGLEHNSEYVFRVLTSNKYGSVYSNNGTCVTGAQENQDSHKTTNAQLVSVIGGLFGGFVFIVILIAMGAIFKNYIKAKQNSDKESLGNKDRSAPYEDQFCGEKDHQYEGIVSATAGNIELYSTVS